MILSLILFTNKNGVKGREKGKKSLNHIGNAVASELKREISGNWFVILFFPFPNTLHHSFNSITNPI